MYHRIGEIHTGLGNPNPCMLNNKWSENEELNNLIKKMFDEGINIFFKQYGGCDFRIEKSQDNIMVVFGIEPTYQYDKLKLITINSDIENCYYENGVAFGVYGSKIVSKKKKYTQYKNNCKFKVFAEKWSKELRECKNEIWENKNKKM